MKLFGRRREQRALEATLEGHTVLILGPRASGKSALLLDLRQRAERAGMRCAISARTTSISDVVGAMADAIPELSPSASARRARMALRAGDGRLVLLLDEVGPLGTAARGLLRTLRGEGVGVALAATVERDEEHARIRSLALTHREVVLPRMPARPLARVLDEALAAIPPHAPLSEPDRARVVRALRGRPGLAVQAAALLSRPTHFRRGRVRFGALEGDLAIALAATD